MHARRKIDGKWMRAAEKELSPKRSGRGRPRQSILMTYGNNYGILCAGASYCTHQNHCAQEWFISRTRRCSCAP